MSKHIKQYNQLLTSILFLLCATIFSACTIWDVDELREKSRPKSDKMPVNQTPSVNDFEIGNLYQIAGRITAVTITPKANKSTGAITIYYDGVTILPENFGSYRVTFNVAAAEGWNAAIGLAGGNLIIRPVEGMLVPLSAINIIYTKGMTLADITLPNHYSWDNPETILNAGDGQVFPATYTDPSGNYGLARGNITINIAKADGVFIHIPDINTTYTANMTLANLDLPSGYVWNNPATSLHAGGGQIFSAVYTEPGGNYTEARGNVTVNVEKGPPLFIVHAAFYIIYEPSLTLASLSLSAGYRWSDPLIILNAGNDQQFSAEYTDPSGNYEMGIGKITVNVASSDDGVFIHIPDINTTYMIGMTLANLALPNGYEWSHPAASLHAGDGQQFSAAYTDPSGNYTTVSGNITVNVAKATGVFGNPDPINIVYSPALTLANLSLPSGYVWNDPETSLNTGNGQRFPAIYTDPGGNYTSAEGYITVNVAAEDGNFIPHPVINDTYRPTLTLANLTLLTGYTWDYPAIELNAGDGQLFSATYTDQSGNYTEARGNITVNIAKAPPLFIIHEAFNIIYEPLLTLASLPLSKGYEWINPSTSLNAGDGQPFQATYDDPSGNYETGSGSITVNVAKSNDGVFVHLSVISTTYIEGMTLASIELPSAYEWSHPSTIIHAVDGQQFPAVYTDPSGNYTAVSGNITINVAKAIGVFVSHAEFKLTYESGLTLADLSLSAGYEWEIPTTILNAGDGQEFPATYINPNGNYLPASGAIIVNVNKAPGIFKFHPAINTTYTPTLTLANLSLQLESNYTWVNSAESLNAGIDQKFMAAYDDPSGNYEIAHGEIIVNVAKAEGAAVAAPTMASRTNNSITINAVPVPGNGQFVEYAINSVDVAPVSGWHTELTFSGLSAGSIYYIFARAADNGNYYAGAAISTAMEIPNTGIDIGNPAVRLYLDGSLLENGGTTTFNQASQIFIISIDSGTYSEIVWHLNGSIVDQGTSRFTITLSKQIPGSFNIVVEVTSVSGVKNVGSHSFVIQ